MKNLYMIRWKGTKYNGGYVLVGDTNRESAMRRGMNKASAMWSGAEFVSLEEIPLVEGVLWVDEHFV